MNKETVYIHVYPIGDTSPREVEDTSKALQLLLENRLKYSTLSRAIVIQGLLTENPTPDNSYRVAVAPISPLRGMMVNVTPDYIACRACLELSSAQGWNSVCKNEGLFMLNICNTCTIDITHKLTQQAFDALIDGIKEKYQIEEKYYSIFFRLWVWLKQFVNNAVKQISELLKKDKKNHSSTPEDMGVDPSTPSSINNNSVPQSNEAPKHHPTLFQDPEQPPHHQDDNKHENQP